MKTPWRWWRERQATDKTCKHLALMTEDITNITDRLVAFVWEDIEKIIDQMSEDLFRPIERHSRRGMFASSNLAALPNQYKVL